MPINAGDVLFTIGSNLQQVEADLARLKTQFASIGGAGAAAFSAVSKPVEAVGTDLNTATVAAGKFAGAATTAGKAGTEAFVSTDKAAQAAGSSFSSVKTILQGLGLTFGALGIAQGIKEAAGAALEFQAAWTKVTVILRDDPGGAAVLEDFKQKIFALPPVLGTAADNAKAFYQIISSGFSEPAQALELLKNSAIAAAGGFSTTEIAAKTGAAVLQAYGLEVGRSREVFDMMAKTVDLGVVSFEELASELGHVIPIAAANNISFQELSGGIAALTLRGLPASQAITGLRSTVASIISPSEKAAEVAEKLGIRWDAQVLKAKGLQGVLEQLTAKGINPTAEDISILTGRIEATNAVMALTAKGGMKDFQSAVEKVAHASDGAGASAASLAAAEKTLDFQLKATKNEIINTAAALGDALAPAAAAAVMSLRDIGHMLGGAASAMTEFWGAIMSGSTGASDAVAAVFLAFGAAPESVIPAQKAVDGFFASLSKGTGAVGDFINYIGKITGIGPALSAVGESFSFVTSSVEVLTIATIAWGTAMLGLKLAAWFDSIGGLVGIFNSLSAAITTSAASTGVLSLALAAAPYAIAAAAIAGIAVAYFQMSKAQEELAQSTEQANAMLDKLASSTLKKLKEAGDVAGQQSLRTLIDAFKAGTLSAADFQIALGKLNNDLAKFNPGAYFKESTVKSISKMVESLGVKSTGALIEQAKQASSVVEQIQAKLKGFTGTAKENALVQKELGLAVAEQKKRWDEYHKAMLPAAKSTDEQAKAAKKAADEIKGWGSALGVALPKLRETVTNGEKYLALLKKNKASVEDVTEAETKLADARKKLFLATHPLVAEAQALLEATKDLDKIQLSNAATLGAAATRAQEATKSLKALGVVVGTELPAEFGKPTTALLNLEASFKNLGVTSTASLKKTAAEAELSYRSIAESGKASARDIELAWVAMAEAQISVSRAAGEKIPTELIRGIDKIKAKWGDMKNASDSAFTTAADVARKQVSTIFTDFSKGFADILFSAGSFGKKITDMFKEIGKSLVRGFLESGIMGIFSGKGLQGFGGFLSGLTDSIGKLFGGGGGGGGDLIGKLSSLAGLGKILPGLGATAATAATSFATGGLPLAAAGTVPGFLLAGGTVAGTAGAGAAGTGLAAGGAATGGGLGATMAALATNPITIAAAAAIAGIFITRRLTRRGREKEEATGGAEQLSTDVWKGIVPQVQEGKLTIDEGIQAIQDRFAAYEEWLRANLKDQTVIKRSIEGQRATMTESIAALEKMRDTQEATTAAREEINKYLAEAARTGAFSQEFIKVLEEAGASVEDFDEALKLGQITTAQQGLQGLTDSLMEMGDQSEDAFAAFAAGGPITDDLRVKLLELSQATGVSTEALLQSMAAYSNAENNLKNFEGGVGSLSEMMQKLGEGPNPFQTFAETGEILPELEQQIYEFGLNLSDFQDYSDINGIRTAFQGLSGDLSGSAESIAALSPLFEQMGGDMAALNAAGALPNLRAAQGTVDVFADAINKLLPPMAQVGLSAQEMLAEFLKSGTIVPELAAQIEAAGGNLAKFQALALAKGTFENFGRMREEFEKAGEGAAQLEALVKQYGSAGAQTALAGGANIQAVLDMVEAELKSQQTTAAEAVRDELKTMGGNLETSIETLETNLKTAIDDVGVKINENYETARIAIVGAIDETRTGLETAVDTTRGALVTVLESVGTQVSGVITQMSTDLQAAVGQLATDLGNLRTAAPPPAPAPAPGGGEYPAPGGEQYPGQYGGGYPGQYGGGYPGQYGPGYDAYGYPVAGAYQQGGVVPRTGLARVEAGELVLPTAATDELKSLFDSMEGAGGADAYVSSIGRAQESLARVQAANEGLKALLDEMEAQRAAQADASAAEPGGAAVNPYLESIARSQEELLASISAPSLGMVAAANEAAYGAPATELGGATAAATGAPISISQSITFEHVEDAYAQRLMMERNNQNLIDMLARGG